MQEQFDTRIQNATVGREYTGAEMKLFIAVAFWCAILLGLLIFPWEMIGGFGSGHVSQEMIGGRNTPNQPPDTDHHGSMQGAMGFIARELTGDDKAVLSKSCGSYFGVTQNDKLGAVLIYRAVTTENMGGPGRIGGAELANVDVLVIDEAKPVPPIILVALRSGRMTIRINSVDFVHAKECLPKPGTTGSSKFAT